MSPGVCFGKYWSLNEDFKKLKNEGLPAVSGSSTVSDPFLGIRAFYTYRAKNMDKIMAWGIL